MKRFTETQKWGDVWFRKLSPSAKLLWAWILDGCDHAGVIEPDFELASFQIGLPITIDTLLEFGDRISRLPSGKYHIKKFVVFQYGKLSKDCKPHAPVFAALAKHGLDHESVIQNEKFTEVVDGSLREKIIERDGLVCAYTGKKLEAWEAVVDHITPKSRGGKADPSNLVVAHTEINARKSDLMLDSFCKLEGLDLELITKELRLRTSKSIKGYSKGFQSLQDKDKVKETEKEKETVYLPESRVALHWLNEKSGKHFRESESSLAPINARLKEDGVTIQGVRQMISRQCSLWKDTRMQEYLRPETLFGKEKFNGYYAAKDLPVNHADRKQEVEQQHTF